MEGVRQTVLLSCVFCTRVRADSQTVTRHLPDDDFGNIQILPADQAGQVQLPFGELGQAFPFVRPEISQDILKNDGNNKLANPSKKNLGGRKTFIGPQNKKPTLLNKNALQIGPPVHGNGLPRKYSPLKHPLYPHYGHYHGHPPLQYHHLPVYTLLFHSHHVRHNPHYI